MDQHPHDATLSGGPTLLGPRDTARCYGGTVVETPAPGRGRNLVPLRQIFNTANNLDQPQAAAPTTSAPCGRK